MLHFCVKIISVHTGKGIYIYKNNDKYTGDFKEDKKHGLGEMAFHNGSRFYGEFIEGRRMGVGKMTLADGRAFASHWVMGVETGERRWLKGEGMEEAVTSWIKGEAPEPAEKKQKQENGRGDGKTLEPLLRGGANNPRSSGTRIP